jgi:hypothetical protein
MSVRKQGSAVAGSRATPAGSWEVRYHPKARAETDAIPERERKAVDNAVDKLASLGPTLPFPHSSKVMGDLVPTAITNLI